MDRPRIKLFIPDSPLIHDRTSRIKSPKGPGIYPEHEISSSCERTNYSESNFGPFLDMSHFKLVHPDGSINLCGEIA